MPKCQISGTASLDKGRVLVEGKKSFGQAENLDEILQTCAGAITTIMQEFHSVLIRPANGRLKNPEKLKEQAGLHLLEVALYNYLTDADRIGAVSEALDNLLKNVMESCGENTGEENKE